ncbi:MAG: hypothetical protein ACR2IL_09095 [Chitinophagaceae bacterium]
MKLQFFALACLGLTLFTVSSCKKGNNNNNNNNNNLVIVPIDRSDTTSLPSALPNLPISIDFSNPPNGPILVDTFATKVDEFIGPYGFNKNQMTKVIVKKLRMNIENTTAQTFNFVKDTLMSVQIYVDSFGGTAPKRVAFIQNVSRNVNVLEFNVDGDDIKDYFRADYMKILLGFRTQENETLDVNAKFRVNYTFEVTADPSK